MMFGPKSNNKISLLIILISLVLLTSLLTFSFSVLFLQLLMLLITIPILIKKNTKIVKLYVFIYAFSSFFIFLVYFSTLIKYGAPYYIGGSDDLIFENRASLVAMLGIYSPTKILGGVVNQFDTLPFFYSYLALLKNFGDALGGYSTFMPRFMNVYFLLWICMILEKLLTEETKFDEKKVQLSILIFALFPNTQFINSFIFRDTFNLLQIFLIIYLIREVLNNNVIFKKILSILLLPFLLYITYYTRKNSIVFALLGSVFLVGNKLKFKKSSYIITGIMVAIVILFGLRGFIRLDYFIETYSNYLTNLSGDGLSNFVFRLPILPLGIFARGIYALITPFPNFFGLFRDSNGILYDLIFLFIYIGVLLQIIAIPFLIKRVAKFDWLSLTFLLFFTGVIVSTFTFRHVLIYYPFLVPLAVDGVIEEKRNVIKVKVFLSTVLLIGLGLMYLSIKIF